MGSPDRAQVDGLVGGGGRSAEEGVGGGEQDGHGGGRGGGRFAPCTPQPRQLTAHSGLVGGDTFLGPEDFLAPVRDFRSSDVVAGWGMIQIENGL